MTLKFKFTFISIFILFILLLLSLMSLLTLKSASESDNEARIYQLFKSAYNTIIQVENMVDEKVISMDEGRNIAIQILRENKYSNNEYVYVTDADMNFVATPLDPQLHGTNFHDFKDAEGNSVADILLAAISKKKSDIAQYTWNSEREGEIVNITSIAQVTPKWGWIVGTGISQAEADKRFWSTAKWMVLASVVLTIIISIFLFFFVRNLLKVLGGEPSEVLSVVQRVSKGDLGFAVNTTNIPAASIYGSTLTMKSNLHQMLSDVSQLMGELHSEINATDLCIQDMENVSQSQNSDTDILTTAMEEMTHSAHTISEDTKNVAEATSQADTKGKVVHDLTDASINSLMQLVTTVSDAGNVIQELESNVANIASVLDVIRGISEQTNLLALNAAIEAARAGSHGHGFSVVADEVRNLSKKTENSTVEIQSMIENLKKASQRAVSSIDMSIENGEITVKKSSKSSESLIEIAELLTTITDMSHNIAESSGEQSRVGENISSRINSISDNAYEGFKITSTAKKSTESMRIQAMKLENELKFFHL